MHVKKILSLTALLIIGFSCILLFFHANNKPFFQHNSSESQHHVIQPLSLIIVRSEADKELGLGGRTSLPAGQGMLFVFDKPSSYGIWMKDMQFSIDIISLDSNCIVTNIEQNVSPLSYPKVFFSPMTTKYIIETSAGYALQNNLKVGDQLDFACSAVNK